MALGGDKMTFINLLRLTLQLTGVATYYTDEYTGPLYCDRGEGLTFSRETEPWVAVADWMYQTGLIKCHDLLLITFEDGTTLSAKALDAGPFSKYWVEDFKNLPIIVDIPEHLWPFKTMSGIVKVLNLERFR